MIPVYTAAEDALSTAVLERLIGEANSRLQIAVPYVGRGFGRLKKKLPEFIRLASSVPVILLTDLDRIDCAPTLLDQWCGERARPETLVFRVAVREVEAWLLADRKGFAEFSHIPIARLSQTPETLDDPKQTLLNLVWRHSPSSLKHDLVAEHGSGPKQGLAYNERLSQFVNDAWNPDNAAARANSLARARRRINELARHRGISV